MPRVKKATKAEEAPKAPKGVEKAPLKRPMSAFFFFSQEKRAEVQEMIKSAPKGRGRPKASGAGAVPKMLGQMWNDMTPSEKKPYEDQHKEAKDKYDAAVDEESD